jgi:formylglycine-generating enzyme required for sulfatase activity
VATGDPADGDNARTLRETKGIVAAYRPTAQTGSLSVTITPQGAIDGGARWRRTGTSTWRNSGFTQSGLAAGQHSIEFNSISGWKRPASQMVQVNADQTTYVVGTFTLYPPAFTPDGGSYSSKQDVTITCDTPDVTIHYTTNGDDPTENDPIIASGSSVLVGHTLRLKAKAWKTDIEPSEIKAADYQMSLPRPEADLNGDCVVNFKDFALLGNWWLYDCDTSNSWCEAADFDLSGNAGTQDLAAIAFQWLSEGKYALNVYSTFEATGAIITSSTGHGGTTNYTQLLNSGTDVTLTAPAVANDRPFTEWTGDVCSTNPTISFSMDADKAVTVNYGLVPIILVDINDPGFKGQMSKYETTNAQYCQYLNDAKAAGLITVHTDNIVYATSDTGHLYPYYIIYPELITSQIAWSGNTFSVLSRDGYNMDNHPVNNVSWYGAMAFCDYYGYRLPTEWEWRAVADFNGTYTYACGSTIDQSKANYWDQVNEYANPLHLSYYPYTTPAGYYPAYGYSLCDMAGNSWEWTSSCFNPDCVERVNCGGSWCSGDFQCAVSYRGDCQPQYAVANIGFRVCRGEPVTIIIPDVTGMTQAEAQATLYTAGLLVGTLSEEYSNTVLFGHIISQNPTAGEGVPQGSTVNLVISKGIEIGTDIVWVSINDPGFNGQMSKYETTNAQYCQFLNDAKAAGLITVYTDNIVYATDDTEHIYPYFRTYPEFSTSQITWSGSIFSVCSRDGYSMDNFPVTDVSWYGAKAFCDYYGYRLPSEGEWQAVADYDGSYSYGCGTTIDQSKANYYDYTNEYANPLNLSYYPYTSPVGYYPTYGYGMCDMAGNAWEWTSDCYLCGGHWAGSDTTCLVSYRDSYPPYVAVANFGFRACR